MGKRKTRKRSRRSKKGGLYGIDSLCIWYGEGNIGTKGFFGKKARNPGDIKENSACQAISVKPPPGATVVSINPKKMVLEKHKEIDMLPNQLDNVKLKTFHEIEEAGKKKEEEGLKNLNYDIYVVRFEHKCASLGERYELYKIRDAKIVKKPDDKYVVSTSYWKDDMIFYKSRDDDSKLDMEWGNTKREGIPKTSLLLALSLRQRRATMGGKKKRRRRTKKKSRKKRKRTKKRRRRRR